MEHKAAIAKKREKTQVGIWYSTWYNLGENNFWEHGGNNQAVYYRPLLKDGKSFGIYDSMDREQTNFHLKAIADAQIDFIIMDQTNLVDNPFGGGCINKASIDTAKAIRAWNLAGNRRIRYCSGIGAFGTKEDMGHIESEAKLLWERYCEQEWGTEDDHVYIDGKPLFVIFNCLFTEAEWREYQATHETPYCDRFTIRCSTGHVYKGTYGQWGWVMPDGPQIDEDVAVMMPGWYKFHFTLPFVFRERGNSYRNSWKTLLASDITPNYVVINSFNEYAEHTAVFTASTHEFPADYPIEGWIDEDGNPAPSLYWDITKEYIAKYKAGDVE